MQEKIKMNEEEKNLQEKYMEMKQLEEQMQHMQKQAQMVEQQMMELMGNSQSLDEFKKLKQGDEILVPLSSGVFAKATLKDNQDLLINVGANTVISKGVEGTKELMEKQVQEMQELQAKMMVQMQKFAMQASDVETELRKLAEKV